ncbi:MAG: FRG domain-containing protein [Candidatus Sumerlaeota bacterium]|nr:FRG domain-containing protein [Candidatus Sumerlaeota bacterium]
MTKTFRLETLADAVEIATKLTKSWFRGHSQAVNSLVPRLFRPEYQNPIFRAFRPDLEMSTIEAFKRHAAIVSDLPLPGECDRFEWLCFMQHYRTPTRLLDWTENALLRALGFSDRHLFPDLEGLSRMIVSDNRVVGYTPPDPPPCSGEEPEPEAKGDTPQSVLPRRSAKNA